MFSFGIHVLFVVQKTSTLMTLSSMKKRKWYEVDSVRCLSVDASQSKLPAIC